VGGRSGWYWWLGTNVSVSMQYFLEDVDEVGGVSQILRSLSPTGTEEEIAVSAGRVAC
jgi:hypothetical protein